MFIRVPSSLRKAFGDPFPLWQAMNTVGFQVRPSRGVSHTGAVWFVPLRARQPQSHDITWSLSDDLMTDMTPYLRIQHAQTHGILPAPFRAPSASFQSLSHSVCRRGPTCTFEVRLINAPVTGGRESWAEELHTQHEAMVCAF